MLTLSPQIAADLTTFGLTKHCTYEESHETYLKLAKKLHPDIVLPKLDNPSEEKRAEVEERFKELSSAYERLTAWIEERDRALEQSVTEEMEDRHASPTGVWFTDAERDMDEKRTAENFDSRELTETLGKLRL